jgi:hypothetical protein
MITQGYAVFYYSPPDGGSGGGNQPPTPQGQAVQQPPATSTTPYWGDNAITNLIALLNLILGITAAVYSTIESSVKVHNRDDFDMAGFVDKLNVSACIVDYSIIEAVTAIIALPSNTVKKAKIDLTAFGNIAMESAEMTGVTVSQNTTASSPTPAIKSVDGKIKAATGGVKIGGLILNAGFSIAQYVRDAKESEEEPL